MVNKTAAILKKNFNVLFNAKLSSLIFILGPIILILIIGAALGDTSIKNVTAGVYYDEETNFTENFVDKMEARSFDIEKITNLENCKNLVKKGEIDVCMHIRRGNLDSFGGFNTKYTQNIGLYVDFSKQRTVWSIIGSIKGAAKQESDKAREEMVSNLKISVENVLSDLDGQKNRVDSAIDSIESIEENFEEISDNQEDSKTEMENIIDSTIKEISDLRDSLELLENSGLLTNEYTEEITYALSSLNTIESNMESLSNIVYDDFGSEEELEDIENDYLDPAKEELVDVKMSIEEIEINLENIKSSDLERIANPIQVSYSSVIGSEEGSIKSELGFLDYLFPNFLMFFILFSSMIYSAINVMRERKSNSYIRNISSNTKGINFVFSQLVSSIFIVFIQILIIIFIADFFVNLSLFSNLTNFIPFLLLSIFVFSLIGTFLGYLFNSQESSIIGAISISLIFFMFSSIIAPVETLPGIVSNIVYFSPFALLETKLRILLIFNSSLNFSLYESIALSSLVAFVIFLIGIFYNKNKRKEI
ncbi:MAG TPA: ABC transporter permease [Candidatus Nanoarchaeia archaeon]|nr:ABC transporter permease [Candidatus Nanoarchaeia archaeon]